MGVREITVAGRNMIIHELEDVYDSVTGRALTGSWVWDSALFLSEWMATQGQAEFHLQGKKVLELGAGAGVPGLTAALLGASQVVLTDIEPLLSGLLKNVEANGLRDRVEVRELLWGTNEALSNQGGELGEFDIVLMSDVLFDPEEMEPLAKTLRNVCGQQTMIWAANEVRSPMYECLKELEGQGFGIFGLPQPSQTAVELEDGLLTSFAVFRLIPPNDHLKNLGRNY
ncbi:Lysine methyltransferase [Quillaja saponaria]|uniref:Lysine methyltransferase n=1 Tax=Quillaja saponaria TaxID=32244 RepID=A0AAD7L6U2_QUISA|nr:Lysine methyltransferase [Quillaja saponaria]